MKGVEGKLNLLAKVRQRCGEESYLRIYREVHWNVPRKRAIVSYLKIYGVPLKSSISRIGSMNIAGLTANPKYELKSDSALVPRGKAEKYL